MTDTDPAPTEFSDAELADMAHGTLIERMGIVITSATRDRVVGTMPVTGNTQPYGLLHGGASVVLAESLGSIAAVLHAGPQRAAVGIDINATHHKAVRPPAVVTAVASPIRLGGAIACYEIIITDEAGERVCTSRLTCAVRPQPPATATG